MTSGGQHYPDACPTDHQGAAGGGVCPVCGTPLPTPPDEDGRRCRYRSIRRRGAVLALIVAAVGGVLLLILAVDRSTTPQVAAPPEQVALRQWWSTAQPGVTGLQDALYDAESALRRFDAAALKSACQHMHDAAAVEVPAELPSPHRQVTAELTAAAEDAHSAAHMCLAVVAKSPNNYDGEFNATIAQAEKQMRAAMTLVNRVLTARSPQPAGAGMQ
ncbi:hypothetical protein [Mycobacterium sp. GA-2829]|uniref:hypothetical protein n=1 Tax=Mycobacterium sp. GA-2829 TaxID=1772283 RepID=UPI0007403053|nr:hypothetical protein [Mycobacterium sp. GA-2829]KUI32625.1 hypothetical protein AU194_25070 [Mycobacterium sp. GA-2829]